MDIVQKFLEKKNLLNKNRGFTLIELLVSIAIIGILSSIVIINLSSAKQKAKSARFTAEANQIVLAMQLYYDKYGDWPDSYPPPADPIGHFSGPLVPEIENDPLFVPEFYSNWDASYYCDGCFYYYQINDLDFDGKPDCGMVFIGDDVFTYRIPLCLTNLCSSSCGFKYPEDAS